MRNWVQVVSEGGSGAVRDFEDLVFDVAVKRGACEGRGGLQGCQGVGVKRPFVLLVEKDKLSAFMCGGGHDHERSEHSRVSGSVLVGVKEWVFACGSWNAQKG